MKMNEMRVRLTTFEQTLGMSSSNPDIQEEFIASKAPNAGGTAEEIAALGVDEVVSKGKTIFPRDENGNPMLWDYQIRGMFKDNCGMLKKIKGSESSALTVYKKIIDGLIFVKERRIPIKYNGEMTDCQRPLRAQTLQGERVALANSESIPEGATIEFTITWFPMDGKKAVDLEKVIEEWLDYCQYRGIGQWRNSGKGRSWYEILDENGKVIRGNKPETEK